MLAYIFASSNCKCNSFLKKAGSVAKEASLALNSPVISEPVLISTDRRGITQEIDKGVPSNVANDGAVVTAPHQDTDITGVLAPSAVNDPERLKEGQAAVKAQAAFRGYLVISHCYYIV